MNEKKGTLYEVGGVSGVRSVGLQEVGDEFRVGLSLLMA